MFSSWVNSPGASMVDPSSRPSPQRTHSPQSRQTKEGIDTIGSSPDAIRAGGSLAAGRLSTSMQPHFQQMVWQDQAMASESSEQDSEVHTKTLGMYKPASLEEASTSPSNRRLPPPSTHVGCWQ